MSIAEIERILEVAGSRRVELMPDGRLIVHPEPRPMFPVVPVKRGEGFHRFAMRHYAEAGGVGPSIEGDAVEEIGEPRFADFRADRTEAATYAKAWLEATKTSGPKTSDEARLVILDLIEAIEADRPLAPEEIVPTDLDAGTISVDQPAITEADHQRFRDEGERNSEKVAAATGRAETLTPAWARAKSWLGRLDYKLPGQVSEARAIVLDLADDIRELHRKLGNTTPEFERLKNRLAEADRKVVVAFAGVEDVWTWQGDVDDHPESLSCPVVMEPETARRFIEARDQVRGAYVAIANAGVDVSDVPKIEAIKRGIEKLRAQRLTANNGRDAYQAESIRRGERIVTLERRLSAKVAEAGIGQRRIALAYDALGHFGIYCEGKDADGCLAEGIQRIGKQRNTVSTQLREARDRIGRDATVISEQGAELTTRRAIVTTFGRLKKFREDGWSVAIHNDYFVEGRSQTFWLFTKTRSPMPGEVVGEMIAVRGEGETDLEAFEQIDRYLDRRAEA